MMGSRQRARSALFRDFSLEDSATGRFSINPELMMRMLLRGYVMNNRSERRLCEKVHLNLAYH